MDSTGTNTHPVREFKRPRKILLVADEVFRGEDLLSELREQDLSGAEVQLMVVTPALARSALDQAAVDIDRSIDDAKDRLDSILSELADSGISANGIVGDTDPVMAIGDGLRLFGADEILVVGHTEDSAAYAEKDLWKRLTNGFDLPVSALMVDRPEPLDRPPVIETKRSTLEGPDGGEGVPPDGSDAGARSKMRDLFGLFYSLFGTIALGFISVAAAIRSGFTIDGDLSAPVIAILLIALTAFLFSLASNVSLIFFMSLDYEGFWERLVSRAAIGFTTLCLVASAIILILVV